MKTALKFLMLAVMATAGSIIFTSFKYRNLDPKQVIGAWEQGTANQHAVMIVSDKVYSIAVYDGPGKKFISATGGTWQTDGDGITYTPEWDSGNATKVGQVNNASVTLTKDKLILGDGDAWTRIEDGKPTPLTGAWIITGNYANDKVSKRTAPFYPRRTMKVLSGSRFHWIAYNIQTKEFLNAGGGTYTAKDGKYTEHVDFFTKTPESVGKTLDFQYSFVNGDWRHKGQKSTGGAMDECWSRRETLEK